MTSQPATGAAAREAVEAVATRSYGTLVALLGARTRDPAGAEDAVHSAFVAALLDWPASGVPRSPEAWLLTVARRKWIDAGRRRRSADEAGAELRLLAEQAAEPEPHVGYGALAFVCAHPAVEPAMRAPLLLQTVFGFDAAALAADSGLSPVAMSQRLVRTKRRVRAAGARFTMPARAELAARRETVLEAVAAALGSE